MAASEKENGYQCQFVSEVSEDLLCGACKRVAREPHITDCCGGHFCKACIHHPKEDRQPCPSCSRDQFVIFPNKRNRKRIFTLQVCCMMKGRGCEWEGRLENLQAHLDVDANDCQHVDVVCSNECGQSVPRLLMPSHLADSCPNRDFFCHHCNFTATYRVVRYDHWPECPRFPVPCPNGCSVGAVERADMEDHIKVCLLQEVACGLSRAGCRERFLLQDEDRHMEDNTQRHILLMAAANHRMGMEFEAKLQKQRAETDRVKRTLEEKGGEIAQVKQALEDKTREIQVLREEKGWEIRILRQEKRKEITQIKQALEEKGREIQALREEKGREIQAFTEEKGREIQALREENDKQVGEIREEVASLVWQLQFLGGCLQPCHAPYQSTPPVCFTVHNFNELKADQKTWTSPDLYTQKQGYKICVAVDPNGWSGSGYIVRVAVCVKPGEHDAQLKWPARASFTLQLLNQHGDHAHLIKESGDVEWEKPIRDVHITAWLGIIALADLEWNADKQTQYLVNDCLVFRLNNVHFN